MVISIVKRFLAFVLIMLAQVFVLNKITVMGYATPMVFIFSLLLFRKGTPRGVLLVSGFLLGLVFDIFTNTPGVGSASCTLLAMVQPVLLNLFVPRDCPENLEPSIKQQGLAKFSVYLLLATFLFYVCYYLLLAFSLIHWQDLFINIIGGTLFSYILMMGLNAIYIRS